MSKRPWMPHYPADYIRDTRHLTRAQHGSYRLLIDEYWMRGGLPNDETMIARLAGMTPQEWKAEREVFTNLFGPGWTHKRIDAEMEKCAVLSEKRKKAVLNRKFRPVHENVIPFRGGQSND